MNRHPRPHLLRCHSFCNSSFPFSRHVVRLVEVWRLKNFLFFLGLGVGETGTGGPSVESLLRAESSGLSHTGARRGSGALYPDPRTLAS